MKPNPFSELNHFTMPVAIWLILHNVPLRAAHAAVSILPKRPPEHTPNAANRGAARIRTSDRLVSEKRDRLRPKPFTHRRPRRAAMRSTAAAALPRGHAAAR
ncbi:hypothetical protein Snoj_37810 [Streptomyces nojiriensis]|uniref:Secreted protein n=1 Tax=Streptomyces nojiriensis TaxID=66374 RepID=A0ABQ3SNZ5_9ACTN|nr:hypothetical protein GCM10010205_48180 [Streptomyces nojiriensis]GHI69863.1 hypothetical protein Snoj_37810 [Streptomyces nojiriensis]